MQTKSKLFILFRLNEIRFEEMAGIQIKKFPSYLNAFKLCLVTNGTNNLFQACKL